MWTLIDTSVGGSTDFSGPALVGPTVPVIAPRGLPGLIHGRHADDPDRIACQDAERSLSYRLLELLSDSMARRLTAVTDRRGPVIVRMRRGVDVAVALLGILKSGCSYVFISVDEPDTRAAAMVRLVDPVAFVGSEGIPGFEALPSVPVPVPGADDIAGDPVPLPEVDADQPVYTMFTSGSTGTPKGVVLGSTALCNRLLWMQRRYPLGPDDRVLQKTPYTFDPSGWELFWPLLAGARCVFAPEGAHRDPAALAEVFTANAITVCHFVPAMLETFLRVPAARRVTALRHIFCSGEVLTASLSRRCLDVLDAELHNLYGPTEAAIDVTCWDVPSDLSPDDDVPIGEPIDNTALYVLDRDRRPVPPGTPGELMIVGTPVALGYAGRDDLTELSFPRLGGERAYLTGDMVRQDGSALRFLGRVDDQVKIGGVRVEPLEVERVLATARGVGHVAVVPVRGPSGENVLVAVLAPDASGRAARDHGARDHGAEAPAIPSDGELREHARAHLPTAFVPGAFCRVDRLPVNRNGKTDRERLGRLAQRWLERSTGGDDHDLVRLVWSTVLHQAADPDDDTGFLSCGGTSLGAMRLAADLRERLGVEIPLSLLLDTDISLAGLREYVATAPVETAPERMAEDTKTSPLAPEQRRMWLLNRLYPDSPAYNVTVVTRFAGAVDRDALAGALNAATCRHDALRARVVEDADGEPGLVYESASTLELSVHEVARPLDDDLIDDFARGAAATVIRDQTAPMARARLLCRTDRDEAYLVLVFNHLIIDQRGTEVFLADVARLYSAAVAGEPEPDDPGLRYAEYAWRSSRWAAHSRADGQADIAYWRHRLADAPPELSLPFRCAGDAGKRDFDGAATTVCLDAAFTERLDSFLRDRKVTRAGLFTAAFGAVLARWAGQDTVVIGVPSSRRRTADEQDLVGFLIDTLPIRLDLGGLETFDDLLRQARRRYAEALEHSGPPFDEIVSALRPPALPHRNPVFQVWVNDLSGGAQPPAFGDVRADLRPPPVHSALFDLGLYLHGNGDALLVQLVREIGRFDADVAAELLDQCVAVIGQAMRDPAVRLADLDLVTVGARKVLPDPGRLRAVPETRGRVLADVEDAVSRFATRSAIVAPGLELSYQDLWRYAGRLAGEFRSAGVGRGDIVEIRAARDAMLPVAVLGCWLADATAAFVDAGLPASRLNDHHALLRPRVVVSFDSAGPVIRAGDPAPAEPIGPEPLSHVLFTSGTTDTPSAVGVPHGPLHAFLTWYTREFSISADDRFALLAGPAHDPILRDMFAPLTSGATVCVPPDGVVNDPAALHAWLRDARVSVLHATPALLELSLGDQDWSHHDLRLIVVAGAPLTTGLARRLRSVSRADIINAYGTTETPQVVAYHRVDATDLDAPDDAPVPLSDSVPGHVVVIRGAAGRPAGIGERGEIVVYSRSPAAGYLRSGERGDAFGTDPAYGLSVFRTGDYARLDGSGRIHVCGRRDRQVSIGGHRVELGEVEAAALRHPAVRQSIASMSQTGVGPVLTLQVTAEPGRAVPVAELRTHLRGLLPGHAVPVVIGTADALPIGPTQKVSPRATFPETTRPATRAPENTEAADRVAAKIAELLGAPIDPEENFFEAGLNSVTLLQLHRAVVADLPTPFPLATLFSHPNLRALTGHFAGQQRSPVTRGTDQAALLRHRRSAEARQRIRQQLRAEGGGL